MSGGAVLRITCAVALFLATIPCVGARTQSPYQIAITHVTVIDAEKGLRLDDQTVLLEAARLQSNVASLDTC